MSPADEPFVYLPEEHREAFREPLGPIETSAPSLLDDIEGPLITVGDVVTYHCEEAGRIPDVSIVDGRTKRESVDPTIEAVIEASPADRMETENPPGTITKSLVDAVAVALRRSGPTQLAVDGEEDLAAIPAILLGRPGSTVVYGQPDEGMVAVRIDSDSQARARRLFDLLEGDRSELEAVLARHS